MALLKDLIVQGSSRLIGDTYASNIRATGSLTVGNGMTVSGEAYLPTTYAYNIAPRGSYSIGTAANKWNTIYATNIGASGTPITDGYFTNISGNLTGALVPETLTDLNSAIKGRTFRAGTSAKNRPETTDDYTAGMTIATDNNLSYLNQLAFYGSGASNKLYIRSQGNTAWGSWRQVLTDSDEQTITGVKTFNPSSGSVPFLVANDKTGTVTNLNADLLDGTEKASLLTAASLSADGNNTKVTVTVGGTSKSGSVTVPYATSAGSATSATSATTATNLANKPSLAASGTTQITVTAGGKTSDAFTVPYATSATNASKLSVSAMADNTNYYLGGFAGTSGDQSVYVKDILYLRSGRLYIANMTASGSITLTGGISKSSGASDAYVWNTNGGTVNLTTTTALGKYLLKSGDAMTGTLTARNIATTHNSYDIGTSGARWRNIYSVTSYASNGFFQSSDVRKKNVLGDLDLNKAYELIDKCQTILYTLKDDPSNKHEIGLIAQEVREIFPELVNEDETGMLSLDYARLTVIILKVLKDLISRISKLEASK